MNKGAFGLSILLNIALAVALFYPLPAKDSTADTSCEPQEDAKSPPVIYIRPGTFSDTERTQIMDRVIKPYTDYQTCLGAFDVVAFRVEKSDIPGYPYQIEALSSSGEYNGFLQTGSDGTADYYIPELILKSCVDVLPNADQLRDQAIDHYNG